MKYIIPILFLTFLLSCGKKTSQSTENYYFPVTQFNKTRVYTFVNQKDTNEKSYWHMKTSFAGNDTILQTSIHDTQHRVNEIITERISGGNAYLKTYTLYNYDMQGKLDQLECTIIENDIFRADQKKDKPIRWKVSFPDVDSNSCEMTKTRSYLRAEKNRKIFDDQFQLIVAEKSFSGKYSMTTLYAKDTGIVGFIMELPGGTIKNFQLVSQTDEK